VAIRRFTAIPHSAMLRTLVLASLLSASLAHAAPPTAGATARHPMDDTAYDAALEDAAGAAAQKGGFFRNEDLDKADSRGTVPFTPTAPASVKLSGADLYRRSARSTLMLVAMSQKDLAGEDGTPATTPVSKLAARKVSGSRSGKVRRTGAGGATAFVVHSAGGVIVTCRHALEFDGPFVLAAVTAEGRVIAVKEILLADRDADIAFLSIDATDLPALPLAPDIDAGEPVRVMSHPSGYYFHMSDGIVARHSRTDPDDKDAGAPRPPVLDITADIAEGSSGGAVLDACGNVVGVAQSYAIAKNDEEEPAFKHRGAIPSTAVLGHMKPVE
jgi:S1-C subfamily serine protease